MSDRRIRDKSVAVDAALFFVWGRQFVGVPIFPDIPFLQSGKVPVQSIIIVFPVSFSQSESHPKTDNALHIRINAGIQDRGQILFRVVDIWQDRRYPYDSWDASLLHFQQDLDPPLCAADMRLDNSAEILIVCSQRHLDHTFRVPVDFIKQVDIL